MNNIKKNLSGLFLGLVGMGAVLSSTPAMAGSATGNMLVSATVINACLIVPGPLAFGTYDPTAATPTTTTSSVVVTCTLGDVYSVGLGTGTGTGATLTTRKMTLTAGSAILNYQIFSNATHTTNWDTTNNVPGTGTGLPQTLTAYGLIPAQQATGAGIYTDTVVATINY